MRKMLKMLLGSVLLTIIAATGASIAAEGPVSYEKDVQNLISTFCQSCHGSDSPTLETFKKAEEEFRKKMKGPRINTYANLMILVNGSDTGALMRRLDDGKSKQDGNPGNMYHHLGGTDEERAANLGVLKSWIGGWTLKRKAEITAEELKAIKALEK